MKSILAILSFVLLIAITANAQTENDSKKEQTLKIEQSSSNDQSTLSATEDGKKKCEGKSKEECKKQWEEKEKVSYHKNHKEMSKKECKPDRKKECCATVTEEVLESDGTSEQE
ncbi:MAG: hypothetical protein V3V16_15110 [Melioribacteraceae bacterium]